MRKKTVLLSLLSFFEQVQNTFVVNYDHPVPVARDAGFQAIGISRRRAIHYGGQEGELDVLRCMP